MFFSLLADEAAKGSPQWVSYVLIGVLVVILIVSMVLMNRRSKKREAEDKARRDAVKPGNKVTTIGGVCGIVVEVNAEEDTFVLETGTEATGKCFMKFVRQAILESDAVTDKNAESAKEAADKETGKEIEETSEQPAQVEAVPAEPATEEVKATEEKALFAADKKQPAYGDGNYFKHLIYGFNDARLYRRKLNYQRENYYEYE